MVGASQYKVCSLSFELIKTRTERLQAHDGRIKNVEKMVGGLTEMWERE